MCSLCRLPVAKKHNFGQILTFWGLLYRLFFTDEGQIWCARADPWSTLSRQISSECVHCVGFRWPKNTILGKFWHFGGSCTDPLYRWGPNVVCYSRPMVYAYVPNFVSIGLFCRPLLAKKKQFLPFFGLRHLALSPVGNSLTKLNTVHNYKPSPIQRHQNHLCTLTPS